VDLASSLQDDKGSLKKFVQHPPNLGGQTFAKGTKKEIRKQRKIEGQTERILKDLYTTNLQSPSTTTVFTQQLQSTYIPVAVSRN
jgi:hypothetical protein